MANKKIKDLETLPSGKIQDGDFLEVQEFDVVVSSKKVLVSTVNELEETTREAADDAIEAGIGLTANGLYNTPSGTFFLDASYSVMNALEILDANILDMGDLEYAYVTIDVTNFSTMYSFPLEIVPAQGASKVIELVTASAYLDYDSIAFVIPAGEKLVVQYYKQADPIVEWGETFVEAVSDTCEYGTWTSNVGMHKNLALEVALTADPTSDDAYDGTIYVFIAYLVRTITR